MLYRVHSHNPATAAVDERDSCAHVFAWGDDGAGQCLGGARSSLESIVSTPSQVRLPEDKSDLVQLSAGWEQSFIVSSRGSIWGGGSNQGRCLSEDNDADRVFGVQRVNHSELDEFKTSTIDAGREHFVAVSHDGSLLITWGCSNEFGQTGQGADRVSLGACSPRAFSVHPGVRVCSVSCGQDHVLTLTERGEVFSWGDGSVGQLGMQMGRDASAQKTIFAPARVEAGAARGLPMRQIAAGMQHSLALGLSGQVLSWGCNRRGRLGLGAQFESADVVPLPTLVAELPGGVRNLAAGGRHSIAVLRKGLVLMAGDNRNGQLGQPPEVECRNVFTEMSAECAPLQIRAAAAGEAHTLLLSYDGMLYGLGAGDRGQVGEPLAARVHAPRHIKLPDPDMIVWAVAAGPGHSLVLASEPPSTLKRIPSAPTPPRSKSMPVAVPRSFSRSSTVIAPMPVFSEEEHEEKDEEEEEPLQRSGAYHGPGTDVAPLAALEVEELPTRLRSSGCSSKLANSGKLVVPMSPARDVPSNGQASASPDVKNPQQHVADGVLLRSVVRPGVAAGVQFACFTTEELDSMIHELPPGCTGSSEAFQQLQLHMSAALKCPTVLGASFLFRSTNEARLNASALCDGLRAIRQRLAAATHESRVLAALAWAGAAQKGLQALAPAGGLLRNVRTRDQIRALVVYLLVPDWPLLLADYPVREGGASGGAAAAAMAAAAKGFAVVGELLRTLARLPIAGRVAFCDIVAEECGDIGVLQEFLLPAARAMANAIIRHCAQNMRLDGPVWDSVLLLQLLFLADEQRLEITTAAAKAAREAEQSGDGGGRPSPEVIARSLSGVARTESVHVAPAAGVALPRSSFHIEALNEVGFPPVLELRLFMLHAKLKAIEPQDLIADSKWEIDSRGALPTAMMSFLANGNLVPVSFKQKVLQAENVSRQAEEQTRQVLSGGLLPWMGMAVNPNTVFFVLQVRREQLLHDTAVALSSAAPQDLRKPLKVKFANEDGVDEGGVAKEYFRLLSQQLFAPQYGMLKSDADSRYLWFDPGSLNDGEDFWMVGAVIGLAVYNNLPGLDVNFPPALFKKLKGAPLTFDDFRQVFPSHATSLQAVLDWIPPPGSTAEAAERHFQDIFCLDFSVSFEAYGEQRTVSLIEGQDPPPAVTLARRAEFSEAFQDWYLTSGVKMPFDSFQRGFSRVCGSPVFNCLSAQELEAIVCGEKDLDFDNLRKGSLLVDSPVQFRQGYLQEFWTILKEMDTVQKQQFLKFVTGSDLAPLGGLERLALKIQRNGGEPTNRLPTSHTCFNLLMLPEYESPEKLRQLLLSAIQNAEGFGLE